MRAEGRDGGAQSPDTTQEAPHAVAIARLERGGWRGPYVGGTVGFSQGGVIETVSSPPPEMRTRYLADPMGGCSLGTMRWWHRRILLGGEADIAFPYFFEDGAVAPPLDTRSGILADEVDMISTVRARIGWTSRRWLFYTTVGASASQLRLVDSATAAVRRMFSPGDQSAWCGAQVRKSRLPARWRAAHGVSLSPTGSCDRQPSRSERRVTGDAAQISASV